MEEIIVYKGKKTKYVLLLGILIFSGLYLFNGCATTGTGEAQQQDEQMSAEEKARLEAKQDSLKKAYRYELLKAYSTGNEHHKNKNFIQ